jgi:hypothetical protein
MQIFSKLNGFPDQVNAISLKECELRRHFLTKQINEYGIKNINFTISERFNKSTEKYEGEFANTICDNGKSIVINHIKTFYKWYHNTSDEYGVFMEDDADYSTIKYWGFTWSDFIKELPQDWECVQLHVVHSYDNTTIVPVKLWARRWYDWSAAIFIAKRSYIKKILDACYRDGTIILQTGFTEPFINGDTPLFHKTPFPENVIYSYGKVYTFPLFLENIDFFTTFTDYPHDKGGHIDSYNVIKQWWKDNQYTHNLIQMMQL